MNRALPVIALCAFLAACAAQPVATMAVPADVPVPIKCTPDLGPEPQYADSDAALRSAANIYERIKLMLAGRLQRIDRDKQKTAALAACGAVPE